MPRKISRFISERESELPGAMIVKLLKIAAESKDIISLGPGEPDFVPDKFITDFAAQKLKEGFTHYSPAQGRLDLREALAKKLKKENKINVEPDRIAVTCGSQEAIFLALACLVDPGESVLIPDPGFLSYRPCVELLNGSAEPIELKEEEGFQITGDAIRKAVTNRNRTRVLIINSPGNPTGAVFSRKTLEEIADIAIEYDLTVLSDEAYEKFVYKGKHVSFASLSGMGERALSFHSFSKSYGMPGFRVGYVSGPRELINAITKIHPYTTLCSPTVSQEAALAALSGPQKWVDRIVADYDRRRKFIVKKLNEIRGFHCFEPDGAFYAFPRIDFKLAGKKMTSLQFCEWLLKEAKVACVPGTEFGKYGEGFVRFSYATAFDRIEQAMERIEKAVKKLKV
ncbi:MAG: pyridoxal phosphate-dependent aminotransferase [Nanoarchaeota archaeon]|nr:pyridoxal phosphate-dependent aminotransferase [Nanoarchaeota archaeon]